MTDTNSTPYTQQKERLEDIVVQIRAKDMPLEKSLDLYDEALAIGTKCVEQLEQTDFTALELSQVAEHPELTLGGDVLEEGSTNASAEGSAHAATGDSADADEGESEEAAEESSDTSAQ